MERRRQGKKKIRRSERRKEVMKEEGTREGKEGRRQFRGEGKKES